MLGSLTRPVCTSLCVLVCHLLTGTSRKLTLQPEPQRLANSAFTTALMPALGAASSEVITSTFALPLESAMIQSASALPARLNGAGTLAVTPATQVALAFWHAGGIFADSSKKWVTTTGIPASLACLSCGCSRRG